MESNLRADNCVPSSVKSPYGMTLRPTVRHQTDKQSYVLSDAQTDIDLAIPTPDTVKDTGNIQTDTGNVQTDTVNDQTDTGNVQTHTVNDQTDTDNVQTDRVKDQTDTGNVQTDTFYDQTNTGNVQTDTVYDQTDMVNSQTDSAERQTDTVKDQTDTDSQTETSDLGFETKDSPALSNIDMTPNNIRACQEQDKQFHPIIEYLSSGTLPKSQKKARLVLLQQADYALLNNMLFHSRVAKAKRTKIWSNFQLVLPGSLVLTVLKLFHDSPLGAHGGIQDTIDRIREHYYFPRLATIVSDYVKSCHECQARKVTKIHRQNTIVAYPTPSAPFAVWEVDLYGPIPITAQGSTYIFTALDMFSRYLYAVPIPRKDAITVAEALFSLFTTFGICDTLVSDCGSEFTAAVTQELCKMLQIPQQFTPSFVHHCLGACERVHATLAARLTPFMNKDCNNWDKYLPSVVFAINNAVNSSTGYSPFEVLFGQRPKFPLANHAHSFKSLPTDTSEYIASKANLLSVIRTNIHENLEKSQTAMIDRANQGRDMLKLTTGDYIYLDDESTVAARKLRHQCAGPYVVDQIVSPHMFTLIDPEGKKQFPKPIHLDRVKPAYVRQETPGNFFIVTTRKEKPTYVSVMTQTVTSIPDITQNQDGLVVTRPKRTVRKPLRYRDDNHISPDQISFSDSDGVRKIKRVLAQRHASDGIQYLIQQAGEPAQNAVWVSRSDLNAKAKQHVSARPPPLV